jgi:hypothetical protein
VELFLRARADFRVGVRSFWLPPPPLLLSLFLASLDLASLLSTSAPSPSSIASGLSSSFWDFLPVFFSFVFFASGATFWDFLEFFSEFFTDFSDSCSSGFSFWPRPFPFALGKV